MHSFQPPVPAKPWKEEKQVVKDSEICIQRDPFRRDIEVEGSEDCLYLNVYTPQVKQQTVFYYVACCINKSFAQRYIALYKHYKEYVMKNI